MCNPREADKHLAMVRYLTPDAGTVAGRGQEGRMADDSERPPRGGNHTTTETFAHQHQHVPYQQGGAASSNVDNEATVLLFTNEELEVICSLQAAATQYPVMGQLPGPSLGIQVLRDWCHSNLHASMKACALVGNGFFEVSF